MISDRFIDYYGKEDFLEMLIAKLVFWHAKDLSDAEIERCLEHCVLAKKLIAACKELRAEIDWDKVLEGQRQDRADQDYTGVKQLAMKL